jgi:hypothetical protein
MTISLTLCLRRVDFITLNNIFSDQVLDLKQVVMKGYIDEEGVSGVGVGVSS